MPSMEAKSSPRKAIHPCRKGCGRKLTSQGRWAHEARCSGGEDQDTGGTGEPEEEPEDLEQLEGDDPELERDDPELERDDEDEDWLL